MRGRIALHLAPGLGWTKPLVVACCAVCGTELARNRSQDAAARAARHVRCPTCGTRAARRLPGTTSPATDLALTRRRPRRRHSASTTPPWEESHMSYRSLWQIDMGGWHLGRLLHGLPDRPVPRPQGRRRPRLARPSLRTPRPPRPTPAPPACLVAAHPWAPVGGASPDPTRGRTRRPSPIPTTRSSS